MTKMQANNLKQKGNTVSKKKEHVQMISQRTEPNMCSYIYNMRLRKLEPDNCVCGAGQLATADSCN